MRPRLRLPGDRERWAGPRELTIFAVGYIVYFGVRSLTEGSVPTALRNAARIEHVERLTGVAWEPRLQDAILSHHLLVRAANWVYMFGHWPLLLLAGFLLFRYRRAQYYLLRNSCLLSGAVGLVVFALFPVAPPRLAHIGVVDTVTRYASGYRAILPASLVNQYAAMPSFHAGWNVLLGIAIFRASRRRAVRAFAVAMPILMVLAVVATANHFILDAVVGTAIVVATVVALDRIERRRARPTLDRDGPGDRRRAAGRSHLGRAARRSSSPTARGTIWSSCGMQWTGSWASSRLTCISSRGALRSAISRRSALSRSCGTVGSSPHRGRRACASSGCSARCLPAPSSSSTSRARIGGFPGSSPRRWRSGRRRGRS